MSPDEEKSYKDNHGPDPRNPSKDIIIKDRLHARYLELIETLNPMLPHSQSEGVSAFDGIDDDGEIIQGATADDAEELFADAPLTSVPGSVQPTTYPVPKDKPFEV